MLLIENSPSDVRLILETFREAGIHADFQTVFHVVEDGMQAMAYLRQEGEFAGVTLPDLILLDLSLPQLDGREVLAEIKADTTLRQIPVVVLTASESPQDILYAYDHYANCYITKPADIERYDLIMRSIQQFWLMTATLPPKQG